MSISPAGITQPGRASQHLKDCVYGSTEETYDAATPPEIAHLLQHREPGADASRRQVRTNKYEVFEILLHLRHRLQSRDKQPIETSFLKKRPPSANCVSPCCLICDRLLETDRTFCRASGFRSPAHLPAVYLEAGASVKWQTVPEISFNKSLGLQSPSSPLVVPAGQITRTRCTLASLTASRSAKTTQCCVIRNR